MIELLIKKIDLFKIVHALPSGMKLKSSLLSLKFNWDYTKINAIGRKDINIIET